MRHQVLEDALVENGSWYSLNVADRYAARRERNYGSAQYIATTYDVLLGKQANRLFSVSTMSALKSLTFSLAAFTTLSSVAAWRVEPFKIDIPEFEIAHAKQLGQLTRLPGSNEFQGAGWDYGTPLSHLNQLKDYWLGDYNWTKEQEWLNSFKQYTVEIEDLRVHYVHEASASSEAIPLLMLHGWPGSFHEYLPTVRDLVSTQDNISFNVVIPSLPGFTFSSAPPVNWTIKDTARIFNMLMTEVLGYKQYLVFGSDWGSAPAWHAYQTYTENVRAAHFAFIPFQLVAKAEITTANVTLDPFGQEAIKLSEEWTAKGNAYLLEQTFKPNTIGLALLDNPVGQFSWIGQIIHDFADPAAGAPPSTLNTTTTITAILLYVYTRSFLSSTWIYSQNSFPFIDNVKVTTDAPMGFSAFKYNPAYWPHEWVAKVGNLVFYHEHESGGHFPGLENPSALVDDLRLIGSRFNE